MKQWSSSNFALHSSSFGDGASGRKYRGIQSERHSPPPWLPLPSRARVCKAALTAPACSEGKVRKGKADPRAVFKL